jgi:predicted dehydrogenase
MRLALLGSDDEVMDLALAAEQSGYHDIVGGYDIGDAVEDLRMHARRVVVADDWERILERTDIDAVVVAATADDDELALRLRVLAQTGLALLISHPPSNSPLFYHELDMIRQDTGVILMPLVADRWHPYILELSTIISGKHAAAKIEQVTLERSLAKRDKASVMRQFMRDVCLLRSVCGELDRVSALSAANAEATFANLGVQLSGEAGYPIRWSVVPAVDDTRGRLILATDAEQIRIEMVDYPPHWRVSDAHDLVKQNLGMEPHAPYLNALEALQETIAGTSSPCDWSEACRSVELADAVEQSLRRGRAIQLHDESYTEDGVFKGLMGMAGCGLILLGLVVAVVGTTAGALLQRMGFGRAAILIGQWPWALLAIFVVFLLLQSLRLVVPVAARGERPKSTPH